MTTRLRLFIVGLLVPALLGTPAVVSPPRAAAQTALATPLVVANSQLQVLFGYYGDGAIGNDRWTGGDGAYSQDLPDGRRLWMFSDTFLGVVNSDHSRSTSTRFVNNSMVVQEADGRLTRTLLGGPGLFGEPIALVRPREPQTFYWLGDSIIENGRLHQFLLKVTSLGLTFAVIGMDVATFKLPELTLESVVASPGGYLPTVQSNGGAPVGYGEAIVEDVDYTYVYGVESPPLNKYLHVARVPTGHLLDGTWEYWDGLSWSTNPALSARVLSGVSDEMSVVKTKSGYRAIAQYLGISSSVIMSTAPTPQGPWSSPTVIYETPESRPGVFTYNAKEHPELAGDDHIVVSYNVNGGNENYVDVDNYRPRFINVYIAPDLD